MGAPLLGGDGGEATEGPHSEPAAPAPRNASSPQQAESGVGGSTERPAGRSPRPPLAISIPQPGDALQPDASSPPRAGGLCLTPKGGRTVREAELQVGEGGWVVHAASG